MFSVALGSSRHRWYEGVCRSTWEPNQMPAMPPKLTFYSSHIERDLRAQLTASQPAGSWQKGFIKHGIKIDYDTRSQSVTISAQDISLDEQVLI